MRDWVRERVGSLKTPELIEIRDELPQTATGKILRRQIRTELSDELTEPTGVSKRAIRRLLTPVRCLALQGGDVGVGGDVGGDVGRAGRGGL